MAFEEILAVDTRALITLAQEANGAGSNEIGTG